MEYLPNNNPNFVRSYKYVPKLNNYNAVIAVQFFRPSDILEHPDFQFVDDVSTNDMQEEGVFCITWSNLNGTRNIVHNWIRKGDWFVLPLRKATLNPVVMKNDKFKVMYKYLPEVMDQINNVKLAQGFQYLLNLDKRTIKQGKVLMYKPGTIHPLQYEFVLIKYSSFKAGVLGPSNSSEYNDFQNWTPLGVLFRKSSGCWDLITNLVETSEE